MVVVEMSILQKILNYMTRITGILDEGEMRPLLRLPGTVYSSLGFKHIVTAD